MVFQIRTGSVSSLFAAGFLAVSAIVSSLVRFGVVGEALPNVQSFNSTFDPDYLMQKWQWQRSTFTPSLLADFFGMFGLLLLILTAQQLRKVYRSHDGVAHRAMFYCFAFGGFLPTVAFLQDLGATSMADWMADPDSTWKIFGFAHYKLRALDISFTVISARSLWIFSMVNLMIGFGLCFEYYLERINHKEHGLRHHAVFSLAVSGVAFIAWILEIASFWSPSQVLATAGFINLVFVACLCAWCLWLAIRIFPNFDVNAVQQMDYI